MAAHPFSKSISRFRSSYTDFTVFKSAITPDIRHLADKITRFAPLQQVYRFRVDDRDPQTIEFSSGLRITHRNDIDGTMVYERGPSLVYSLGPTGAVAALLYPAKSALCRPLEQCIILHIGTYGWYQLYEKVPSDLNALAAYGHVTSLDGDATLYERAHIWWLRRICRMNFAGITTDPKSGFEPIWASVMFIMKSTFNALFNPFAAAAFALLLIRFGYPEMAQFLSRSGAP